MVIREGLTIEAKEPDGKIIVVPSPATEGWRIWFTGAGDDLNPTPPASGRGEGQKIRLSFETTGSQTVSFSFVEPVELHDGQLIYTPPTSWSVDDRWSFFATISASVAVENTSSLGNCNLVPTGLGYNVIIPALGDGAYDIDLDTANPVPAEDTDGFWDLDAKSGVITPSPTPFSASWHLLDIPISSYFLKNMPMGHPMGVFDVDVYKTEYFHPKWVLNLTVERATSGSGEVGGWLTCFRKNVT